MLRAAFFVVIAAFTWFCLSATASEDSKSSQRHRSKDANSINDDLNKFLDDILKESDSESSSCKSTFVEEDNVILRTTESVHRGAEFLAASEDVQTVDECKRKCCETSSKESSRKCDFITFRKPTTSTGMTKCFLFSCTTKNGENVCSTAPNSDYTVLRIKEDKVEHQLLDVISNSSANSEEEMTEEIDEHGICLKQFTKKNSTIIRTRDSIQNGAVFIKAPSEVSTIEECQSECCTAADESLRHCDLAVFQSSDGDSDDTLPKCYLFSCTDDDGVSRCITAPNSGYIAMIRTIDAEDQLLDVASNSVSKSTSTVLDTTKPVTTPTTKSSTTTTTSTSRSKISSASFLSCKRLEWQCDNGDCIKVTEVCNGKTECSDKSDEDECQSLIGAGPKDSGKGSDSDEEPKENVAKPSPTTSTTSTSTVVTKTTEKKTHSTIKASVKPPESPKKSAPVQNNQNLAGDEDFIAGKTEPQKGAVLPLALGLSVTMCVLLMVGCRVHIMKRKLRRRGKPLTMEESDYLINGMYL